MPASALNLSVGNPGGISVDAVGNIRFDGLPAIGANGKAAGVRGVEPIVVTSSQA
jgi:hypothetical protein